MIEQKADFRSSERLVWAAPDETFSVQFQSNVADRLTYELEHAATLPKRRAEVGGLLRGTVKTEGARHVLVIQDIEPVTCAYSTGPTWTLSASERIELLQNIRNSSPPMEVLGFYRSNTRPNPGPDPTGDDLFLYDRCFVDPYAIIVIVNRVASSDLDVQIYCRGKRGALTLLPPVGSPLLQSAVVEARSTTSPSKPLAGASRPLPAAPRRQRSWVLLLALALGAVLTIATVVLAYKLWRSNAAGRDSGSPFSLQVENRADHLMITWNPASRLVIGASRGRLSVRDGGFSRNLDLTAGQVRSGKLFYLRSTNEVELHLELEQQDGRRVGESVIFMAAAAPAAPNRSASIRPPATQKSGADDRRAGNPRQPSVSQPDASAILRPSANRADDLSAGDSGHTPAARIMLENQASPGPAQFVPPAGTKTEQSRFLDAPPPIADRGAAAPAVVLRGDVPVQLQPPQPAPPPQPPPPKEQPASANPSRSYAATLPEPIRQVAPVIPPSTRQLMHGRTDVRIRVAIDATGKVTQASVASKNGPMAAFLADAALKAAYEWQFKPAYANGHPLPSDKILEFTFTGK